MDDVIGNWNPPTASKLQHKADTWKIPPNNGAHTEKCRKKKATSNPYVPPTSFTNLFLLLLPFGETKTFHIRGFQLPKSVGRATFKVHKCAACHIAFFHAGIDTAFRRYGWDRFEMSQVSSRERICLERFVSHQSLLPQNQLRVHPFGRILFGLISIW